MGESPLIPVSWWVDVTENKRVVHAYAAGQCATIEFTLNDVDEFSIAPESRARFMQLTCGLLMGKLLAQLAKEFDPATQQMLH